jgi:hypothetical protein
VAHKTENRIIMPARAKERKPAGMFSPGMWIFTFPLLIFEYDNSAKFATDSPLPLDKTKQMF